MSSPQPPCNPRAASAEQVNADREGALVDSRPSTTVTPTLSDLLRTLADRLEWAQLPASESYTLYLPTIFPHRAPELHIGLAELRRLEDDGGPPASSTSARGVKHFRLQRAGVVFLACELRPVRP